MDFQTTELNTLVIRTNPAFLGYLVVDGNAKVTARGSAVPGSLVGASTPPHAIAIAIRQNGTGYYLLAPNGTVYAYGEASNAGNGVPGGTQAVSIAVKPSAVQPAGRGYWILAENGKVGAHHATHHGDLGSAKVEAVSIVATPDGGGYWILTASGSVHKFGNAALFGDASANSRQVHVGMAATPDGKGYWILATDGSVSRFGNAGNFGPGLSTGATARAIAALPDGRGYWILTKSGEVHAFGTAPVIGGALPGGAAVGIVVKRP